MRMISFLHVIAGFARRKDGIAAVETVFAAPLLVFMALGLADVGISISERMTLDQALRAGAQVAMINGTEPAEMVSTALGSLGESSGGTLDADGLCTPEMTCISAVRECSCSGGSSSCGSLCPSTGLPPAVFMSIEASRRYEGIILGERPIRTSINVQVR